MLDMGRRRKCPWRVMSENPEPGRRIAYALLAFVLGLSALVLYSLVQSNTWVHLVGIMGAYLLSLMGILVLSRRGLGSRLMLSGKSPSSRFRPTHRRWKYVAVAGLAAVATIV